MEALSGLVSQKGGFSLGFPTVLASFALIAVIYAFKLLVLRPRYSALRVLPGPPNESFWFGNLGRIFLEQPGVAHIEWAEKYGGAIRYRAMFGDDRVMFTDPIALNHILLSRAYDYPKPNEVRGNLSRILGKGVLFAEGEDHRRQRRIMNPAFSPSHIRDLTPTFFEMSYKLRDKWVEAISSSTLDVSAFGSEEAALAYDQKKEKEEVVIEVAKWLSRVTLDIIGLAGFGYNFGALDNEDNKLGAAFAGMLNSGGRSRPTALKMAVGRVLGIIIQYVPIAKYIPNERISAVRKAFATMDEESRKIVAAKKVELKHSGMEALGGVAGKDLITLLLKSNINEGSKSFMTDAELQGQMTTFILAGHETTSTALTWVLWTLARHSDLQIRLRDEVRAARNLANSQGRDELESDELNSLPFLDAVCREILRFEAPVSATIRTSSVYDSIPLSSPIKGANGKMISSVPITPGQTIFVSLNAVNKSQAIFGEDASIFRPDRWLDGSISKRSEKGGTVGIYSQMLTFLAGPRACIGYKFAVVELKAILSVLIDNFTFAEREADMKIERRSTIVTRPLVVGEEQFGHRMPLRVKIAQRT